MSPEEVEGLTEQQVFRIYGRMSRDIHRSEARRDRQASDRLITAMPIHALWAKMTVAQQQRLIRAATRYREIIRQQS